jgi:probable rRNA maturation factor
LRIVDEAEMTGLNEQYRKKSGPTNVLSFPADLPQGVNSPFLGDIIICAPVVAKEAKDQGKSLDSHWAHMTVHGILHLQGYNHIDNTEAEQMESLEIKIMQQLGFANPYDEISTP